MINIEKTTIELIAGYRTALSDGTLVPDSPLHMATEEFYHAYEGDSLTLNNDAYLYSVAIFSLDRDDKFIYTYDYQKEENWTTYTVNVTPDSYICDDYIFQDECYFRVNVKRADGKEITAEDIDNRCSIVTFCSQNTETNNKKSEHRYLYENEVADTVNKIQELSSENTLSINLLTDSHNVINGTWETTIDNMSTVADRVAPDYLIHLGDLTDGMVSKELTSKRVKSMIGDMKLVCSNTYITLGNHDHNYFRNKSREFSPSEINEVYGFTSGPNYTVEVPKYHLTFIFLDSFDDNESVRYGYKDDTLTWLSSVLIQYESGRRFLIFSHCPPLEELDFWSYHIRNGRKLVGILDEANTSNNCEILGLIYGHTHSDFVFDGCSFPLIGIGCNKLEYFLDKKPKGAITAKRKAYDISQDLWDTLVIDFKKKILNFVRFGAGEDRSISYEKKDNTYEQTLVQRQSKRTTKIWAHRGASGYVPENTIPAFEIALEMGADGIETDVQLTRDGIPVIIHDERIDRVSDGTGYVKDYTLAELKKFNFNNKMNRWGFVQIPTLEEFLSFVVKNNAEHPKLQNITINLELKNGIINYEGLEQIVIDMVDKYGLSDSIVYSSFNHESMKTVKSIQSDAQVGFLYSHILTSAVEYALNNDADALHPGVGVFKFVDDLTKESHKHNIKIHTWTINEQSDIDKMKQLGVDAIITNYLDRAL